MPPAFFRAYVLRGAVVWMGLRGAMAVGGVLRANRIGEVALVLLVAGVVKGSPSGERGDQGWRISR